MKFGLFPPELFSLMPTTQGQPDQQINILNRREGDPPLERGLERENLPNGAIDVPIWEDLTFVTKFTDKWKIGGTEEENLQSGAIDVPIQEDLIFVKSFTGNLEKGDDKLKPP